jgi:DNA-binding GntR family transcriptional regulator
LKAVGARYDVGLAKNGVDSEARLLELVEAGDGAGAEAHLREHLERSRRILRRMGNRSIVDVLE